MDIRIIGPKLYAVGQEIALPEVSPKNWFWDNGEYALLWTKRRYLDLVL